MLSYVYNSTEEFDKVIFEELETEDFFTFGGKPKNIFSKAAHQDISFSVLSIYFEIRFSFKPDEK